MSDVTTEVSYVREVGNGMESSMEVPAEIKSATLKAAEVKICAMQVEFLWLILQIKINFS